MVDRKINGLGSILGDGLKAYGFGARGKVDWIFNQSGFYFSNNPKTNGVIS